MGKSTSSSAKTNNGPSVSTGSSTANINSNNSGSTQTNQNRGTTKPSPGGNETQKPAVISLVEPPPGTEPKQKKNRPSGMTYNKSGSPAPARSRVSAATPETVVLIQSMIQGVFAVGAGRLGSHWQLSNEEAEGIAVPAANIIAKYMDTDLMAKYSDPLALLIALGVVIAPRVVINVTAPKKEVKTNGPAIKPAPNNPSKQVDTSSGKDSGGVTVPGARDAGTSSETNVNELFGIVDVNDF